MIMTTKGNPNYCATIVVIENIVELDGCDNIQGTHIFGNHVIVSKDIKIGDVGIYFPVECSIKEIFLKANNLYRDKTLNIDQTKAGFFELNGRVRCMKLRGFKSEGFWIPLNGLSFFNLTTFNLTNDFLVGTEFDHIDGVMVCEKYVVKKQSSEQKISKKDKRNKKIKRFNKLIEEQFRFHIDTAQMGKNLHQFKLTDLISISEKVHGISAISSYILCNKKLSIKDKIAKFLRVNVIDKEYENIYSSRRAVKNQYLCKEPSGFYSEDIWKQGNDELKDYLDKGMTIYYEICGYLKDGKFIQSPFDYGCETGKHSIYIYRITSTNIEGKVFEWSMKQIQDWCKEKGLQAVPLHYYGTVQDFIKDNLTLEEYAIEGDYNTFDIFHRISSNDRDWQEVFLKLLMEKYLEKDCSICKTKLPNEGVCIRREVNVIDVYKLKSFRFRQLESKILDEGKEDIEEQNLDTEI
jgi:hypothetical protein